MADVFIEHMVKRESEGKLLAVKLLIVAAAIVAILAMVVLTLFFTSLFSFLPLFIAGAVYGAWILIRRRNLEFEYIVTNGEMDIDKIIARRSRKRMLTVNCRNFDILAPMVQAHKNEYEASSITKRIDVSSSPTSARRWFAVFNGKDGARTLLIFEPSEKMLDVFKKMIPRKMPG